jgi:flagellar basal-body rod protein FlgG
VRPACRASPHRSSGGIGGNLLKETPASGTALVGAPQQPGFGSVLQGFLETSNVNAVEEITNLISAQRAYEMNSKVIQATDQMLATLSNAR